MAKFLLVLRVQPMLTNQCNIRAIQKVCSNDFPKLFLSAMKMIFMYCADVLGAKLETLTNRKKCKLHIMFSTTKRNESIFYNMLMSDAERT